MTVTHPPIVVAEFTVVCGHGHTIIVITDGTRVASASPDRYGTLNTHPVTRTGTRFEVPCPRFDVRIADSWCPESVTVDQSDHTAWRAATVGDAAWLDTDAQTVDVEP
jgi:hypothetical protein